MGLTIQYLIKRNFQLRNEIKLWAGSAIYYQYMMLAIMKHNGSSEKTERYE